MDNDIKNISQTSNLIDLTQDNTNSNTYECLISSERNNINEYKTKKEKKVKFSAQVVYIDVECWKKYNEELTSEENFNDIQEENESNDNNDNQKVNNGNNKRDRRSKKNDKIFCTCIII